MSSNVIIIDFFRPESSRTLTDVSRKRNSVTSPDLPHGAGLSGADDDRGSGIWECGAFRDSGGRFYRRRVALIFNPKRWSGTNGMLFGTGLPNRNPAIDMMTIIGYCPQKRKGEGDGRRDLLRLCRMLFVFSAPHQSVYVFGGLPLKSAIVATASSRWNTSKVGLSGVL